MNLLIATTNKHKLKELEIRLKSVKGLKIVGFSELDIEPPIIVEDGTTFRANAVKKALTLSRYFEGFVLADDSGIEVDALCGKPGVRSSRFSRINATDAENNKKLIKLMENVPEKKRTAQFVCVLALARKGELLGTFEGFVKGRIVDKRKGKNGFGYDPLFQPDGCKMTFGEMPPASKNKISHRTEALKKLEASIGKYL
ncbi:MAG: RdgB/HAM1 family non-canonical purine NTP pyrophosphatase [Candidatus Omnitrophica bacterium]|nr:RdgB/HAM1 family non-canonical purine NTP pyrophosphatase [Candidatus Omnitrophota bacterium]